MQAVLLAAGESSRFFPYNQRHKSLIEIAGEPIVVHTIRAIKRSGISDVIIAVPNKSDFQNVLGNGKKYGVKIQYVIDPDAAGAGETILKCAKLLTSDFFVANAGRVEFEELKHAIDQKRESGQNVILVAKKYADNRDYGVLKLEKDRVVGIVEKPKSTEGLSNLRVLGFYFLTQDFLQTLKKEAKHHYSFESALDAFAKFGKVRHATTEINYLTFKYPWDLLEVKNYLLAKLGKKISKKANVSKHSIIEGNVVICDGATISENATIKGPAYIGKNAFVGSNSLVRNCSSVEENAVVGSFMEVKNSLVCANSKTHSGHLEDSVLGSNSRLGALFTSANVRLDRKNVKVVVKGEPVDTNLRSLGAVIGSNTHVGVRVTTMPGVIIGNNTNVGPSTTVMKNVDSDLSYYTKVSEIIERKKSATKSS